MWRHSMPLEKTQDVKATGDPSFEADKGRTVDPVDTLRRIILVLLRTGTCTRVIQTLGRLRFRA